MLANKALSAAPSAVPVYVEDVFSTYLYVGNGSTQTITNNIDLSTKGGLVWVKWRSGVVGSADHALFDTSRGVSKRLSSNTTDPESTNSGVSAFGTTGFTLGSAGTENTNNALYTSWTFAKQAKFFDVVTYTGNGSNRTISHNLGSVPGCIIVREYSSGGDWIVYHRSLGNTDYVRLNTTGATAALSTVWNNTTPTSTEFTVGTSNAVNANGSSFVAYLFAHDAGGFGASGSDNVITCGSYTGDGTTDGSKLVSLGYEPQWVLVKRTDSSTNGGWHMIDVMRGMPTATSSSSITALLLANTSAAENLDSAGGPKATGFSPVASLTNTNGATYIYIAIRRGPMKTPTTGTSIFIPTAFSGNDTSGTRSAGLNAFDLLIAKRTASSSLEWVWLDKLRGLAGNKWLSSVLSTGEGAGDIINTINGQYTQDGINITKTTNYSYLDAGSSNYVWYALKRAPGFFDEVCYTGTGSARTVTHNLGVTPELMIVKVRSNVGSRAWRVYASSQGATKAAYLDANDAFFTSSTEWNDTAPTSSVFTVGTAVSTNGNGDDLVAYLFASLTGVSKVGTYTGNGSSQTINCGFTAGARLILIKRTDSSGDWYIYDTARGIVSGNDSQLKLNTTAVAATGFDAVDPDNSGFIVNNDATNFPINVSSATYIYLAIA